MTMQQFIEVNRAELVACIQRVVGHVPKTASCDCSRSGTEHQHEADPLDDDEVEQWVVNDEGLYNWARREGVEV